MKDLHITDVDADWALKFPNEPTGQLARQNIIKAHNALADRVLALEQIIAGDLSHRRCVG